MITGQVIAVDARLERQRAAGMTARRRRLLDVEADVDGVPVRRVARLGRLQRTPLAVEDDATLDQHRVAARHPQQPRVLLGGRCGRHRRRPAPQPPAGAGQHGVQRVVAKVGGHHDRRQAPDQ